MEMNIQSSKILCLGKDILTIYRQSATHKALRSSYRYLSQAISKAALAKPFKPFKPSDYRGLGTALSSSLRKALAKAFSKFASWFKIRILSTSLSGRVWGSFTWNLSYAPVNTLGEILFGFSTVFFSLGFSTLKFSGTRWITIALFCFLLGLLGTVLPSRYFHSSILQKFSSRPFAERRDSLFPILLGVLLGVLSFLSDPILVLAGLFAVAFCLWMILSPDSGLYALAAYAPLDYFLRANLPSSLARIWPLLLMALMLIGIALRLIKEKNRRFYFTELGLPLLLFLLWNCVSLAFSEAFFSVGFEGIRAILQTSIFFFLTVNAIRNRKKLRSLLYFLTLVLVLISLYAIYQHIIQVPVKPGWVDVDFEQDIKTRSYSIFPSPNALSGYIVLFFPLVLTLFLEEKRPLAKVYFLGAALLMGLALMYTLTRAGWLVCGLSLLLLGLLHDRRVLVFLLILGLALPFLPEFSTRLATMITGEYWIKSATAGRLYRWQLGLEIAEGHPLFGTGPGTFGGAVAYRAGYWPGIYADNYYIKTAAELGYAGLALFLVTLVFILIGGFRRLRSVKDKDWKNLGWAIQTGIFAFMAHNFTENLWEEPPLTVAFWFLCGLLYLLPLLEREHAQTD